MDSGGGGGGLFGTLAGSSYAPKPEEIPEPKAGTKGEPDSLSRLSSYLELANTTSNLVQDVGSMGQAPPASPIAPPRGPAAPFVPTTAQAGGNAMTLAQLLQLLQRGQR